MSTSYQTDIVSWANEQANYIRAGFFDKLDLEHLAQEIEDVGKSEQRELASRMAVLLAHLLKWQFQPALRGSSWAATISVQRERILRRIEQTPSLRPMLTSEDWISDMWADARLDASKETGISFNTFPNTCPWAMSDVLSNDWLP